MMLCGNYLRNMSRQCFYFLFGAVSLIAILFWISTTINQQQTFGHEIKQRKDGKALSSQISTRQVKNILLISYLKGGSSFLGEILGLNENHFYVYEPLHKMATFQYFKPGLVCRMEVNNCKDSNDMDKKAFEIVKAVHTCQYNLLVDQLGLWQICRHIGKKQCDPKICEDIEEGCVASFLSYCSDSVARVSKVARISMSLAVQLLETVSNLKIVHLIRDPRAILNSRQNAQWKTGTDAGSLCRKMGDDFEESTKLKQNNPGKVFIVYYEDLAMKPIETAKAIFDFAGFEFGSEDLARLSLMTQSTKPETRAGTTRHHSGETAHAWRSKIPYSYVQTINKACSDIYNVLGYPEFADEKDLRNTSVPSRLF